jgi:hypothetical protein
VTDSRARQDKRPDWLKQKHSQRPANPKLAEWAAQMRDELDARFDTPVPIGPFRSEQAARAAKNALYDAVEKRWNRAHPDDQLSLSANLTNPADGKCYARSTCRCEQNECTPTPGPGWHIHARLRLKKDGRTHQGKKPRETWDYDPMVPGSRQATEPIRAFGADRIPATEDEPPDRSGFRRGAPQRQQASGTRKGGQAGNVNTGPGQPEQEDIISRLRRAVS